MSGEKKGLDPGGEGESKGLVPAAICNTSVLQHEPTTADGKEKTNVGRGKIFYPRQGKSGPANIFSCRKNVKLQEPQQFTVKQKGEAKTEAVFSCDLSIFQTGVTSPSTELSWEGDRATLRQALEGYEHLQPACLLLSRPLATPQNKLFNATVSVSCERSSSRTRGCLPSSVSAQKS